MRESATLKARRNLAEGGLLVLEVTVDRIAALCRDDTGIYSVGNAADEWACDCPVRSRRCSHLQALHLVTVADPRHLRHGTSSEAQHA
jgi:hypothetical protein